MMRRKKISQIPIVKWVLCYGFFMLGYILMLTGCNIRGAEQAAVSDSTEKMDAVHDNEYQSATEELSVYSIAAKNWKIKDYLVEGTDNLYELPLEELSGTDSWITGMKPYGAQFVVIWENDLSETKLYLINPLTTEIAASIDLPAGMYSEDGIWINDKNQLEVLNLDAHELMVFNEKLQEIEHISVGDVRTDNIVVTKNHEYCYFLDYEDGYFYQYQTKTRQKRRIFSDVNCTENGFGRVVGLLNQDTCLAFCYSQTDSADIIYEVRELATGGILYQDGAEINGIECEEASYLIRHFEEGLLEILYGNENGTLPQVLSLKDYKEYEHVVTDLQSKSVVSSMVTEDAWEAYRILAEEHQLETFGDEEQKVTMFSVNQYNLETGKRQYAMDFYYVQNEEGYFGNCRTLYLEDAECIICYIDGTRKRWLVWDLTKESSKAKDETNYLYQWQDPLSPDKEALDLLRERAGKLGKENGVEIYIGEEINNCPKDIYDYKETNHAIRIEKMLNILEKALAKYPEGMLEQLGEQEYEGSKLHIYLAGGIVPINEEGIDSIGIQNTLDNITFLVLDVNSFGDLENTIYHEIFHAIEKKMDYNESAFFDYEVWNDLNPEHFSYDYDYQINKEKFDCDYTVGDTEHEVYFIDTYSKSFPGEDRARIIEYAMLDVTDTRRRNIESPRLQAKLKYICEQIRKGFNTTGWPEKTSWEEALN